MAKVTENFMHTHYTFTVYKYVNIITKFHKNQTTLTYSNYY